MKRKERPHVDKEEYLPLEDVEDGAPTKHGNSRLSRWNYGLAVGYVILALWTVGIGWSYYRNLIFQDDVYSPLQPHIRYEMVMFNQGLWHESTNYMGTPSNDTEAAWSNLVHHGIIKLSPEEAVKLYDPTVLYRDDEGNYDGSYIAAIEMWHQLHCLNFIRKAIWAEEPFVFYGKENTQIEEVNHIDHCIDYLRQVLMCHGDVGIIGFRWNERVREYQPNFNKTHTCRAYEPLLEWADTHQADRNTPEGPV